VYEDQFVGPRVNVARSEAHFLASVHTVDLASGRELAVRSIESNPRKENRSTTGIPEYPGEVEVQDQAVREAVAKTEHLYFPWMESRQVPFMNSKECNLKTAYDLLRAGDTEGALKLSQENVEACKSDPKVNHQADAWYNLGITYYLADDYDHALSAMTEANKLHSDRTILDAITGIRQEKASTETMARAEAQQAAETERARTDQAQRSQDAAKAMLTNDSVVKLVKGGLSPDVVVRMIASQPAKFSLTPDDLLALKQAGVPDAVIAAMLDKR
jgi:tetratricopeptide (TPR) repeat protein